MKTLYILNVKNSNSEDCLDDLVRFRECSLVSELIKDIVSVDSQVYPLHSKNWRTSSRHAIASGKLWSCVICGFPPLGHEVRKSLTTPRLRNVTPLRALGSYMQHHSSVANNILVFLQPLLTLGAHAQRGFRVCVDVCVSVCLSQQATTKVVYRLSHRHAIL